MKTIAIKLEHANCQSILREKSFDLMAQEVYGVLKATYFEGDIRSLI